MVKRKQVSPFAGLKEMFDKEIESLNTNSAEIAAIVSALQKQNLSDKDVSQIKKFFKESDRLSNKFKKQIGE